MFHCICCGYHTRHGHLLESLEDKHTDNFLQKNVLKEFAFAGLIWLSRVACVQIGLLDSVQNSTVAHVDLEGDLHFDPIYVNTSDMPRQYAALQKLYSATGGQYWSALFQQDGLKELQTASITADTGDGLS